MSPIPYDISSGWSWPEDTASEPVLGEEVPLPSTAPEGGPEEPDEVRSRKANGTKTAPKPQKHYPPRTCRICLEVVLPSFEPATEGIAAMLNPAPRVSYISSDPESGRLIRPCKCKGSQKYVHEGCLQAWRHADPRYGRRNYWECPTCKFRYHLERMRWSRWISSALMQIVLTVSILFMAIFFLGFVADPVINFYFDPYDTIISVGRSSTPNFDFDLEDEDASWAEHFLKGLASLGLLGLVYFAMSPWTWWNLRQVGILGGGRGRRGGTGRDRLESITWSLIFIGVVTFLYAVWTWVRSWSRRTLEKAGERVVDVQGNDNDDEEIEGEPAGNNSSTEHASSGPESQKTQ